MTYQSIKISVKGLKIVIALRPMTQNEQEFAEREHQIVIDFLRYKHLSMEDFYDIIIFGYLSAVQRYIRDQPAGVPFRALAIRAMKDALYQDRKYNARVKRCGYTMCLDDLENRDKVSDSRQDTERQVTRKILLERAVSVATPKEASIIRLLIGGYRLAEAAQRLHISKGAACVRMQRFYRRARAAIG